MAHTTHTATRTRNSLNSLFVLIQSRYILVKARNLNEINYAYGVDYLKSFELNRQPSRIRCALYRVKSCTLQNVTLPKRSFTFYRRFSRAESKTPAIMVSLKKFLRQIVEYYRRLTGKERGIHAAASYNARFARASFVARSMQVVLVPSRCQSIIEASRSPRHTASLTIGESAVRI